MGLMMRAKEEMQVRPVRGSLWLHTTEKSFSFMCHRSVDLNFVEILNQNTAGISEKGVAKAPKLPKSWQKQ